MSVLLNAFRYTKKNREKDVRRKNAARSKQRTSEAEPQFQFQNAPAAAMTQQHMYGTSKLGQEACANQQEVWEDVYDDGPFDNAIVFHPEYSEWKFIYGPSECKVLYVIRLYRTDRLLFVNGIQVEEKDYEMDELPGGNVVKIHFKVGKYKCLIKSALNGPPSDANQTLLFDGNRIQFDEDEYEAE